MKQRLHQLAEQPSAAPSDFKAAAADCLDCTTPWGRNTKMAALSYGYMVRTAAAAAVPIPTANAEHIAVFADAVTCFMQMVTSHAVRLKVIAKVVELLTGKKHDDKAQEMPGSTQYEMGKMASSPVKQGRNIAAIPAAAMYPRQKLLWLAVKCWNWSVELSITDPATAQQYLAYAQQLAAVQQQQQQQVQEQGEAPQPQSCCIADANRIELLQNVLAAQLSAANAAAVKPVQNEGGCLQHQNWQHQPWSGEKSMLEAGAAQGQYNSLEPQQLQQPAQQNMLAAALEPRMLKQLVSQSIQENDHSAGQGGLEAFNDERLPEIQAAQPQGGEEGRYRRTSRVENAISCSASPLASGNTRAVKLQSLICLQHRMAAPEAAVSSQSANVAPATAMIEATAVEAVTVQMPINASGAGAQLQHQQKLHSDTRAGAQVVAGCNCSQSSQPTEPGQHYHAQAPIDDSLDVVPGVPEAVADDSVKVVSTVPSQGNASLQARCQREASASQEDKEQQQQLSQQTQTKHEHQHVAYHHQQQQQQVASEIVAGCVDMQKLPGTMTNASQYLEPIDLSKQDPLPAKDRSTAAVR
jgi:hypothetical protein